MAVYFWMMARYGIRGIFLSGRLWRPALFVLLLLLTLLGGFRSGLFVFGAAFILMFFMEGLHRTQLLVVFGLVGIMACVAIVPFASKLPFTFQRALAFLPLDLSSEAVESAEASTDWRIAMWTALLPQIPPHLLLGKGFAFSQEEYDQMMTGSAMAAAAGRFDESENSLALSSDYHNGMLSIILPFGIWGVLVTFWFLWAGLKVLHRNWKYGDPALRTINAFLFIQFFIEAALIASCVAGLSLANEMSWFIGNLGLSIALNNGMCKPAVQPGPAKMQNRASKFFPHLRPALPR
jgi:hypothetical protein